MEASSTSVICYCQCINKFMIELDSSLVSYFDIANKSFAAFVFQCNSSFLICTPSRPLFLFAIVLQTRSVRDAGESSKYGLSEFAGKMT